MASRFYFAGPYDNGESNQSRPLTANVGPDNFHYVVAIDPLEDDLGPVGVIPGLDSGFSLGDGPSPTLSRASVQNPRLLLLHAPNSVPRNGDSVTVG